ncbi:MAG: hypothetical protein IKN38_06340 [Clostridia bacterium]|nr:hypothetical protein [Clostridia bacterium]
MTDHIKYYEIAGITFSVETPWEYEDTTPYSLFLKDGADEVDTRYVFIETDGLPSPTGKLLFENPNYRAYETEDTVERFIGYFYEGKELDPAYALVRRKAGDERYVEVLLDRKRDVPKNSSLIFKTLCLEHLVTAHGGMILHASFVKTESGAILFTAPSGTGKSTQAKLWENARGTKTVNGDCAVIRKCENAHFAYGLPFAGTSGICENDSAKLCAIVYLVQAKENSVKRLSGAASFKAVMEGAKLDIWDRRDAEASTSFIKEIAEATPVYILYCLPDRGAVDALSDALE